VDPQDRGALTKLTLQQHFQSTKLQVPTPAFEAQNPNPCFTAFLEIGDDIRSISLGKDHEILRACVIVHLSWDRKPEVWQAQISWRSHKQGER
jgi:hypothetical protein